MEPIGTSLLRVSVGNAYTHRPIVFALCCVEHARSRALRRYRAQEGLPSPDIHRQRDGTDRSLRRLRPTARTRCRRAPLFLVTSNLLASFEIVAPLSGENVHPAFEERAVRRSWRREPGTDRRAGTVFDAAFQRGEKPRRGASVRWTSSHRFAGSRSTRSTNSLHEFDLVRRNENVVFLDSPGWRKRICR